MTPHGDSSTVGDSVGVGVGGRVEICGEFDGELVGMVALGTLEGESLEGAFVGVDAEGGRVGSTDVGELLGSIVDGEPQSQKNSHENNKCRL